MGFVLSDIRVRLDSVNGAVHAMSQPNADIRTFTHTPQALYQLALDFVPLVMQAGIGYIRCAYIAHT
jgi:hypothetical protein